MACAACGVDGVQPGGDGEEYVGGVRGEDAELEGRGVAGFVPWAGGGVAEGGSRGDQRGGDGEGGGWGKGAARAD